MTARDPDFKDPTLLEPVTDVTVSRKLAIKTCEMEKALQKKIIQFADEAMDKYKTEMEQSKYIVQNMDKVCPAGWSAVIGKKYGSYVTHEAGYFIYFNLGNEALQVYRSKD